MAATEDISSYVLVLRDLGEEGGTGYALQLAPLQDRRARPTSPSPGSGGRRPSPLSPASGDPTRVAATMDGVAAGALGDTGGGGGSGSGTRATPASPASGGPASAAVTVDDVAHGDTGVGGGGTRATPSSSASGGPLSVPLTVDGVAHGVQGGIGSGGGDGIEEVDEMAAAADRIPGLIRTFLPNRRQMAQIIKQQEKVLIPIFRAPKKNKDDIWDRRQVKYVVALVGPLGFIFAATAYLPPAVLLAFATAWGAGSVGFPMGLYGRYRSEQCFGRHMARLLLMSFSLLVLYVMYLSMVPVSTNVPSSTGVAPASPPGHQAPGLIWTILYGAIGIAVMVGHIISWITGCRTGSDQDEDDSKSTEKAMDTSDLVQRFRDSL